MEPHEQLFTLTNAAVPARSLQVVADLGIADLLDETPVAAVDLARECDVDPDGLDRVLGLLAAHGVFAREDNGYRHTAASRLLREDHPMSIRAFSQMQGLPVFLRCLDALDYSVRTGRPSIELVDDSGFWTYLEDHPEEQALFGRAMTAKAAGDTAAVLGAYDFGTCERIVDVAGGRGHLLHAVLEATPQAHGVLFDLPDVVEAGGPSHPRLRRQAGDFFVDPLPSGDTYLLMDIIHDWADEQAVAILSAVANAAADDARVLIVEPILPDQPDPGAHTIDVIMLAVTGGRERTAAKLGDLLRAAGLDLTRVIPTAGRLRIAEAHPSSEGKARWLAD